MGPGTPLCPLHLSLTESDRSVSGEGPRGYKQVQGYNTQIYERLWVRGRQALGALFRCYKSSDQVSVKTHLPRDYMRERRVGRMNPQGRSSQLSSSRGGGIIECFSSLFLFNEWQYHVLVYFKPCREQKLGIKYFSIVLQAHRISWLPTGMQGLPLDARPYTYVLGKEALKV